MAPLFSVQFTRRELTSAAIGSLFLVMAVTAIGCDDMRQASNVLVTAPSPVISQGDPGIAPAADDGTSGTISGNHGHAAFLTAVQLLGDEDVVISIRGAAGHDHSVTLSANQLNRIDSGERVTVVSSPAAEPGQSGASHSHTIVFN